MPLPNAHKVTETGKPCEEFDIIGLCRQPEVVNGQQRAASQDWKRKGAERT